MSIRDVIRAAAAHDGIVIEDGSGGFEALAPEGCRWIDAEAACYPLPLNKAESAEERQQMLQVAVETLSGGIESI